MKKVYEFIGLHDGSECDLLIDKGTFVRLMGREPSVYSTTKCMEKYAALYPTIYPIYLSDFVPRVDGKVYRMKLEIEEVEDGEDDDRA